MFLLGATMEPVGLMISVACVSAGAGWLLTAVIPEEQRHGRTVTVEENDLSPEAEARSRVPEQDEPLVQMTRRSCVRIGLPVLTAGASGVVSELNGVAYPASLALGGTTIALAAAAAFDALRRPPNMARADESEAHAVRSGGDGTGATSTTNVVEPEGGIAEDVLGGESLTGALMNAALGRMTWPIRFSVSLLILAVLVGIGILADRGYVAASVYADMSNTVATLWQWAERVNSWVEWAKVVLIGPFVLAAILAAVFSIAVLVIGGLVRAVIGLVTGRLRMLSEGLLSFALGTALTTIAFLFVRFLVYVWTVNHAQPA